MILGIKEFRERIREVSSGEEVVIVTHHGKRVGRYVPENLRKPAGDINMSDWTKEREEFGRKWRARTHNWQQLLRDIGTPDDEISALEVTDSCS